MIELKRHLEILLLDNDCVVVPDFGGFVAYHVDAHFDETDGVFVPPMRTLGFNPQLKMNDSLLAQSYVEAYDISYPEAIQRIEAEVQELRNEIALQGSFVLDGIGTLACNDEGGYLFTPCEAGILTPDLYGLCTFEFTPAVPNGCQTAAEAPATATSTVLPLKETEKKTTGKPALSDVVYDEDDDEHVISIKVSWIRNAVAVAAAVVMFFMMSTPVANSNYASPSMAALQNSTIYEMVPQPVSTPTAVPVSNTATKEDINDKDTKTTTLQEVNTESPIVRQDAQTAQTPKAPAPEAQAKSATARPYCIVLASQVRKANAEEYVAKLKQRGLKEAELYVHNHVVRVTYGQYSSEEEANAARNKLNANGEFSDAWVYKKKTDA